MSYEILNASYGAQLRRTEMEIEYYPVSKITDYSVTVMVRIIFFSRSFLIRYYKGTSYWRECYACY